MTHQERQNKKKAISGAILLHILILIGFYFLKLDYTKKEEMRGIAINFGYVTDDGAKNTQQVASTNKVKSVPRQNKQSIKESVPDIAEENVVTQDVVETVVVDKTKEAPVETEEIVKEETPVEVVPDDPQPDENLQDAINSLLSPGDKTSKGDKNNADKSSGSPDGQENGDNDSEILGSGTKKDGYDLGNRRALKTPNPDYDCNETGVVVVRVWVNANGVTTKAEAGVRGSTETSACLVREAKDAALRTLWAPDPEAQTQIGTITYNFYKR